MISVRDRKVIILGLLLFVGLVAVVLLLVNSKEEAKPEELALQTAKAYYDQLLRGDYDAYVEGSLRGDSVAADYREQLVLNMQMFVEAQRKKHGGIDSVSTLRATADTAHHTANAFLTVHYKDRTKEEVVVPMVEKGGIWYLR